MTDALGWLLEYQGLFTPRSACGGGWTDGLRWLHTGSDLAIGMAYIAIPLTLLFFVRRRGVPFSKLIWLFGAFILACGTGHLVEATMFETPVYRLSGVVKAFTAAVSWVTVVALIPAAPQVIRAIETLTGKPFADPAERAPGQQREYIVAVLATVLAVLVRAALDPLLLTSHVFILPLLAVVAVAWYGGLGPALLSVFLSLAATTFLFVEPRNSFVVENFSDQIASGLFLFAGVGCALLGEAQQQSQRRADRVFRAVLLKQSELEAEVARRERAEADLLRYAEERAAAQRQTAATLAQLDTFVMNAPLGMAFLDPELRFVRVNTYLAAAHGKSIAEHVGRTLTDVLPDTPADAVADFRRVVETGAPLTDRLVYGPGEGFGAGRIWESSYYPVRADDGALLGVGVVTREISTQLRTERNLRATQERFRAFIDESPAVKAIKDFDGRYTVANRAFADRLGLTPAEVVGNTDEDLFPPAVAERRAAADREALTAGQPVRSEETIEFGGREYTYLTARFPLPDGTLGMIATDITERKRAEEEARRAADRLALALQAGGLGDWEWDVASDVVTFSERAAEIFDIPPGPHLTWAAMKELIHPDDRAAAGRRVEEAVAWQTDYQAEYRVNRPDGTRVWVAAFGRGRYAPDGTPLGMAGVVQDVTARKRAEEAVRESAARFRSLAEAVPQIVWNADADGQMTYFNTRWLEYTGVLVDGDPDRGWLTAVHPDDADRVYAAWRGAVAAQTDRFTQELRLRRAADGAHRWFLAVAVPLRGEDGALDQWIGSMADIQDQKEHAATLERLVAERTAALEATAAELTRSNEELEKFAYVASHDLQEPLRKIQAFGDRLGAKHAAALTGDARQYLDRMQASAARMRQLIDDLLAFSRVTTKTHPFTRVDLAAVAADAVDDLQDRLARTGGAVDVGPLPAIDADPTQMRQLFQNLIGNALKFHKPREEPRVTVRGEVVEVRSGETGPPREVCRLTVADNGIGFDEKYLDRIFQVFQRLHGRHEYEGTGVGLAICRKIVDRHGGEITARSSPGRGATFTITLPTHQPTR